MIKNISSFLFILALSHQIIFGSDDTSATVTIQPQQILIGQPADLQISANIPSGGFLNWPGYEELEDHKIEILNLGLVDTLDRDAGSTTLMQTLRVTSWEEGYIPIPAFEFTFISDNDTIHFESKATLLEVQTVEVDMTDRYRDIRPLFKFPRTFREILPYLLAAIGLLIIVVLIILFLKKRKKPLKEPTIWEKPEVPAHIAAISSLETLRQKELWQKGHIKAYHSELTTILRKYLYKRFHLDAIEMTTREIVQKLPAYIENTALQSDFKNIFELADMVKFAKFNPEDNDHEKVLEKALEFVKKTAEIVNDKE